MTTTGCSRSNERFFAGRGGFNSLQRNNSLLVFALSSYDMIKILPSPIIHYQAIWNTLPYQMLVFWLSEWFCTRPQIIFNILEPNITIISLHYELLCTTNSCLFGFVATRILFDSLSAVEHIVKVFWNIGIFSQSLHKAWAMSIFSYFTIFTRETSLSADACNSRDEWMNVLAKRSWRTHFLTT